MTGGEGFEASWWFWIAFNGLVLVLLAFDLGVLQRKDAAIGVRKSLLLTGFYIVLALAFGAGIYALAGAGPATEYLTGYILEKSLSLDNIFVFVVIFRSMAVPAGYQHRVLVWGILGALVMRGLFIAAGASLIARFEWIIYLFGAFLIASGGRLLLSRKAEPRDPKESRLYRFLQKHGNLTSDYRGRRFLVRSDGTRCATPLLATLILIEASDVMFALDSIPAIFGVTKNAFLVYTSNVFAILGLRALYFALRGIIDRFRYLSRALALLLVLIGIKMVVSGFVELPVWVTLATTLGLLGGAVGLSLLRPAGPGPAETKQGR